ncbi:DNA-binding response regulator, OmpR family, contains REC and winged-helix (wHTH) domain [Thalassobacillus cyri]|uniref:DNA-binding response regulator, OmpR family, contains REC and winged-helix (WHTH) domain n=1 Tax=Thalassobacillus cyri TaxID=571932 RepID=A0A1H4AX39_9BACI|nr:response regulator transcription factor [Thalassobacillus cyri]SEA40416.1 DNA-binding response regulator, OmpR family, contains REC and winged-helix (wHTH) domain [Thalassobacillus cyri]
MAKALLVDDEQRMLDLLQLYLTPEGFQCEQAASGEEAVEKVTETSFDIVLLDIMMPGMSGWEVCQSIREISEVPIIMVTAREQKEDIVKGLKLGADDYITKPFDADELTARMEALLRRTGKENSVDIDGLKWDGDNHQLTYQEKPIKLTPKEFAVIGYMMKHPNRVYDRHQLIELIWGFDSDTEGRTIDSHVRNMREKIRQSGFPIDDYFQTVWGVGYKWIQSSKS